MKLLAVKVLLFATPFLAVNSHSFANEGATDQRLRVDRERSSVEAEVSATLHSFEAALSDFEAEIVIDPATDTVRSARFAFDAEDLDTDNRGRNKKMRAWLSENQPFRALFVLEKTELQESRRIAIGSLSLNGIVRETRIPFQIQISEKEASITGGFTMDHRDWNLPVIRLLLVKVDPELEVRFELRGSLKEIKEESSE